MTLDYEFRICCFMICYSVNWFLSRPLFCICRWTMWTLLTSSGKRLCCFCLISQEEKKLLFWLKKRKMVSDGCIKYIVCCGKAPVIKPSFALTISLNFCFFFSVSEDSGIRRGWLLLHPDTFWIWERIAIWVELQQGRGVPCSRYAVQRQIRLLACYPYWQEPSGSGKGHNSQQKQV